MRKIIKFLREFPDQNALFISVVVLIFSLLRLPSVIEPYWYGDEGIYEVLAQAMNQGRGLYSGIWDNKPPLLYIIYAIFNGDQFYAKLLSLIFGALSVVVLFFLAQKLFLKKLSVYVSTAFFALLFGLPVLEGNIANAENFMLLPVILSFYLMVINKDKKKMFYAVSCGILLSFAFLIKIVGLFDLVALGLIIFVSRFTEDISLNKRNIRRQIRAAIFGLETEVILIISFVAPIALTTLYFLVRGEFADFWKAALSQNVGYVGYGNHFIFPMGMLYLKLFLLLVSTLLIIRYRKALTPAGLVVLTWLAFSCFSAFFSARPYTHYLLVLLPSFSLFLGYIIENKKARYFTIPLLLVLLFLINRSFNPYRKNISYYLNYLTFMSGGKIRDYQAFFDGNTPRDYEIARFIRSKTNDDENVFLWSDSAQIYALSGKLPPGRYAVAYHITFYPEGIDETREAIKRAKPKYIIQTKNDPAINNFLEGYALRYYIDDVQIYEKQP